MFKHIKPDKWRHFETGILMGLVLQFASWKIFTGGTGKTMLVSFIAVVVISYGFELFSKITGLGRYDFMDAVASAIGGVIGILLAMPFQESYHLFKEIHLCRDALKALAVVFAQSVLHYCLAVCGGAIALIGVPAIMGILFMQV